MGHSHHLDDAKFALDKVIKKSRVHLYKPIQIAEILHMHRTQPSSKINLLDLDSYRSPSKQWRDIICMRFLGRVSTSSARFQDNLFAENAIPPQLLSILGEENKKNNGVVEAYIYKAFEQKHSQLNQALNYCLNYDSEVFDLADFIDQFWSQPGLKRSFDKIFEIVVYALFESLARAINVRVDIRCSPADPGILLEFSAFTQKVLGFDNLTKSNSIEGHFYRVGVTNAADRGLDIYANFGSIVQIKHLSLSEDLAENVVAAINADKIVIVCKSAEKKIIQSLLSQIGWKARIQSIITIDDLIEWYEKALRGKFSHILGESVLHLLGQEIRNEFPSVGSRDFEEFKISRGYNELHSEYWNL